MCTILVADDEYLERQTIKTIVSNMEGASVGGEGNSGRKTVEMCFALKPEIIFMNCNMGGINGYEAARQIRQRDRDVIIIMTSGHDDPDKYIEMRNLNIHEYLLKPIKPSVIEQTIIKYSSDRSDGLRRSYVKGKKSLEFYPRQLMSKEISNALTFIDNNYTENLSLETVAGKELLSSYYYRRLFKKEVGVRFLRYLSNKKLEEDK